MGDCSSMLDGSIITYFPYPYESHRTIAARQDFSLIQSCYPSRFASFFGVRDDSIRKWISQPLVHSPRLACPSGYSPQCTVECIKGLLSPAATYSVANAENAIWSILNENKTAIGCPSNYACDPSSPCICTSRPHAGDIIAVTDGVSCDGAVTTSSTPTTALTAPAMKIILIQSSTPTSSAFQLKRPKFLETGFGKEARLQLE
ncbi:hypothetical protein V8C42DRAFT_229220 [Trichoderma barbatum]